VAVTVAGAVELGAIGRKFDTVRLGVGAKAARVADLARGPVEIVDLKLVAVAPDGGSQLGAIWRKLERPNGVAAGPGPRGLPLSCRDVVIGQILFDERLVGGRVVGVYRAVVFAAARETCAPREGQK
nr:hypothetical protein [Tanacetum cinerariifolium]